MEMTIDEAAYIIEHHKVNDINNAYDLGQAFTVAIDTMRKYQKIIEIVKDDTYYEEYGNNAERFIVSAISEVVEDGNDD